VQLEGSEVEFTLEKDGEGKYKATNITAPGGAPLEPPSREDRQAARKAARASGGGGKNNGDSGGEGGKEGGGGGGGRSGRNRRGTRSKKSGGGGGSGTAEPPFHHVISDETKEKIKTERGLDLAMKSTVDVKSGDKRIKLGQGGYAGYADANGTIAEGTYTCAADATITFTWERCLKFEGGAWKSSDAGSLFTSLSLLDGTSTCFAALCLVVSLASVARCAILDSMLSQLTGSSPSFFVA